MQPLPAAAGTADEKGLAIAREADSRGDGFGDFAADMIMILKNRHGQESAREMRVRTLEVNGDGDKSLSIFDTPRDIKGLGADDRLLASIMGPTDVRSVEKYAKVQGQAIKSARAKLEPRK